MTSNIFQTADEMWAGAIGQVMLYGHKTESRVGATHEILGWSGKLLNASHNFVFNSRRKLSPYYAAGEFLWYLSGRDDLETIAKFAPRYAQFCEADGRAHGAYGRRWRDQLPLLITLLHEKRDTRQAILTAWSPYTPHFDLAHAVSGDKKDLPCTLTLQFIVRDEQLHLIVNMRSNDIWLGMPYDIFCFTSLQAIIAADLEIDIGTYTHNVGSLHIYEKHMTACAEAWKQRFSRSFPAFSRVWRPRNPEQDQGRLGLLSKMMTAIESFSHVFLGAHFSPPSLVGSLMNLYWGWIKKSHENDWAIEPALREQAQLFELKAPDTHPGE